MQLHPINEEYVRQDRGTIDQFISQSVADHAWHREVLQFFQTIQTGPPRTIHRHRI